jgi:colicin import membrane protein
VIRGLTISALLHGGLLAWALVSFSATAPLKMPEPEPVEVAIITEGDIVRLRQGDRQSKQLEARPETKPAPETQQPEAQKPKPPPPPTPPPPQPKAETPPEPPKPEPIAEAKPEPPPEPKPDAIADKIAALPPEPVGPSPEELARQEAARRAEEQKRIEDKKKADAEKKKKDDEKKKRDDEKKRLAELKRKEDEKKKKEFDAQRIAALIDKSPDPRGAPQPSPANVSPDARAKGPTAGAKEGTDSQLTASQRSMIGVMMRQAVSRCWNINAGAQGIDKVVVRIEVMLTRDGRINGNPKVVNNQPGPLFSDAANSALRALVQCEPYDLPANLYEGGWDHMIVTFDPQAMFR